jgi:hypothetical protein
MKTSYDTREIRTELTAADRIVLQRIITVFAKLTLVEPIGHYQTMTPS